MQLIIPKRSSRSQLDVKVLILFHSILVMVENDESDNLKGYDWGKLKQSVSEKVTIYNDTAKKGVTIPQSIDAETIYFKSKYPIAKNFLKSLRNAFAHNYIKYDKNISEITIKLPAKNKQQIILYCRLSFSTLETIIKELKTQKI